VTRFVVDQPGANLALDLFVLQQHLGALLDRALDGLEVTPAQYAVYAQLRQAPRTPGELRQVLGVRGTTLSGYLATMERREHVTRQRSDRDGRSHRLRLTAAGVRVADAGKRRMARVVQLLDARVGTPEEVTGLRLTLGSLDDAVLAATDEIGAS
jgi:DNA-binding MarR family transcriptional regulator